MSVRTVFAGVAATAVAASALTLSAVAPATADPAFTPDANDLVGVGSDTTENVMDFLADGQGATPGFNAGRAATTALLVSWDTVGSAQITPRAGADPITRPVGSGAGKALLYGAGDNPSISYARSSSAINTTEKAAGLQAFPFALDTLRVAVSGSVKSHAPAGLTGQQVLDIYKGNTTNWNQIDATTAGVIKPYIPQSGSGTRSFFDAQLKALNGGVAVSYGANVNDTMHENTDDVLAADPDAIAPFSVGKAETLYPTSVHLESGWSADRALYNVVRGADLGLASVQGVFGESGFVCSTDARPLIEAAGFKQLATPAHGGVCGAATQDPTSDFTLNQQVTTATSLAFTSPAPRSAKLVATITAATSPDGSVSFYEGATLLQAGVPLVSGRATYTMTDAAPGSHTYTAAFVPGAGSAFEGSQRSRAGIVKTSSKIGETFPDTVAAGKRAKGTITVALAGIAAKATGSVKVLKGTKALVTGKLVSGKVTLTLPRLAKGKNSLKVVWPGDSRAIGSTKRFTVTQK